jgi:hypothetical protein
MRVPHLWVFAVLFLLVSSLVFVSFSASAGVAGVYISPAVVSTGALNVGDTFDVSVEVSDVVGLWQWVFGLSWDPSVLALEGSPVEGAFLKQGGSTFFVATPVDNAAGSLPEVSSTLMSASSVDGSGVLATVTFKVVGYGSTNINLVEVHLQGPSSGSNSDHPQIAFTSAGSTFNLLSPTSSPTPTPSPTSGPVLDVYTQRGGELNMTDSDAFGPQELVQLYANVTYNGVSVVGKDVSFALYDPNGNLIAIRVATSDANGQAHAEYRLPWPSVNPQFGVWSVSATVDISQVTCYDRVRFDFNYILNITNVQTLSCSNCPISEIGRTQQMKVNVTVSNIRSIPINGLVCVTLYDVAHVPIATATQTLTVHAAGSASTTFEFTIPDYAFIGLGKVCADILTDLPNLGGVAYCPEVSKNLSITGSPTSSPTSTPTPPCSPTSTPTPTSSPTVSPTPTSGGSTTFNGDTTFNGGSTTFNGNTTFNGDTTFNGGSTAFNGDTTFNSITMSAIPLLSLVSLLFSIVPLLSLALTKKLGSLSLYKLSGLWKKPLVTLSLGSIQ